MLRTSQISTPSRSETAIWIAFTSALTVVFLAITVPDLGRYPLVSGDDSWVMSASYKLATTGEFGSDLYAGFHGADQHYFIALPAYHLLQALSFVLFGAEIATARAVTVASAIVVLWATTWLGLRWYGLTASIITGILLILLRVNVVNLWPGVPLLAVGRTGRYDLTGVAFVWLTLVFLDLAIQRSETRRAWPAIASGVCAGLATLTQFFGIFAVLIVMAMLAWRGDSRRQTVALVMRAAAGWAVVVTPYLLYAAAHRSDFRGQSRLKSGRTDFLDVTFYIDNLTDEIGRYQHLVDSDRVVGNGIASWLFVVAIVPILGWLAWRARIPRQTGDRILLTTLLVGVATLALVDSTNAPLYTIVLWPGCCIAVAAAIATGLTWARNTARDTSVIHQRPVAMIALTGAILLTLPVAVDGVDAYQEDQRRKQAVSNYTDIARELDRALPDQTGVVGHERWWWGLHDRQYLALNVLQLEWEQQAEESRHPPSFADIFDVTGSHALIVDDNARSEISRYPEELRQQIEALLATGMTQILVLTDPTYGRFEVYLRR